MPSVANKPFMLSVITKCRSTECRGDDFSGLLVACWPVLIVFGW
jgi:hypothetical protein